MRRAARGRPFNYARRRCRLTSRQPKKQPRQPKRRRRRRRKQQRRRQKQRPTRQKQRRKRRRKQQRRPSACCRQQPTERRRRRRRRGSYEELRRSWSWSPLEVSAPKLHQRFAELACFEAARQAANATLPCNMPSSFRDASRFPTKTKLGRRRFDQASLGMLFSASSISRKLGWAVEGTLPRPISTEICAALPCRWATSTDWMIL